MTRVRSTEEPCAAKVACTVLKTSGRGDPLAEFNRALRFGVLWRKRSLGTASDQGQPLGGAHPVAPRNVSSTDQVYLHRAGRRRQTFLPWPTARSLLDQRGGEHLCSPPVSAHLTTIEEKAHDDCRL